jgi:hyperosmotically inducible periplasmic protein
MLSLTNQNLRRSPRSVASSHRPLSNLQDSAITTQIKADLAAKKLSSLVHVSVDTDNRGMVTLSGTVPSQNASDRAVSIARAVKGVTSVENHIQIAAE